MSLRIKTLAIVALVMSGLVLVLYVFSPTFLLRGLGQYEENQGGQLIATALQVLAAERTKLELIVTSPSPDWMTPHTDR